MTTRILVEHVQKSSAETFFATLWFGMVAFLYFLS